MTVSYSDVNLFYTIFCLFVVCGVISSYFSDSFVVIGGLSSVMTITRFEKPIDTLESLVQSKFSWGGTTLIW